MYLDPLSFPGNGPAGACSGIFSRLGYNNRHRSCQRRAPISWSLLPFSIPAGGLSTPTSSDPSHPQGPALVQGQSSLLLLLWLLPACLRQDPFQPGLRWFVAAAGTCWGVPSAAGGSCKLHFGSLGQAVPERLPPLEMERCRRLALPSIGLSVSSPPSAPAFLPSPASKGGADLLTLPLSALLGRALSSLRLTTPIHSFLLGSSSLRARSRSTRRLFRSLSHSPPVA